MKIRELLVCDSYAKKIGFVAFDGIHFCFHFGMCIIFVLNWTIWKCPVYFEADLFLTQVVDYQNKTTRKENYSVYIWGIMGWHCFVWKPNYQLGLECLYFVVKVHFNLSRWRLHPDIWNKLNVNFYPIEMVEFGIALPIWLKIVFKPNFPLIIVTFKMVRLCLLVQTIRFDINLCDRQNRIFLSVELF